MTLLATVPRAAVLLAAVLVLTGCGVLMPPPAPTTTRTDASGNTVLVDWTDYPAHAGIDGELLFGFPSQSELEPVARALPMTRSAGPSARWRRTASNGCS